MSANCCVLNVLRFGSGEGGKGEWGKTHGFPSLVCGIADGAHVGVSVVCDAYWHLDDGFCVPYVKLNARRNFNFLATFEKYFALDDGGIVEVSTNVEELGSSSAAEDWRS